MEKRRLSAIMFTDIVGYTRKMGEDEVGMLRLLRDHNSIVEAATGQHEGEIIKRVGDAFLVSFDSALNAVLCAIDIQQALREYNKDKPDTDQVHIRIGIHLGDIVISEGDVFGDGVNVASRIEPLAHPDGICVTRTVYDVVKKKMDVKAVELGPQQLKNVDEAVEVFHLLSETVGMKELRKAKRFKKRRRGSMFPYVSLGVAVLIIGLILWRQGVFQTGGVNEILRLVQNAEVPENRVAVLPLRNLTGREEDQYICEGFSQDLIYRLSPVKELYVYPIESVLKLDEKFRAFDDVRKALGAKYVVAGSVQRDGDSLDVQIELLETMKGERLLSQRYKTSVQNRVVIQERIARDVLYQVVGRVSDDFWSYWEALTSENPLANDLYQQALRIIKETPDQVQIGRKDLAEECVELLEMAIAADSTFAMARGMLAERYAHHSQYSPWYDDSTRVHFKDKAISQVEAMVKLAPEMPESYLSAGAVYRRIGEYDAAETALFKALKLRPAFPVTLAQLGELYSQQERNQEALSLYKQALLLIEEIGNRSWGWGINWEIANIYQELKEHDLALEHYNTALSILHDVNLDPVEKSAFLATIHGSYARYYEKRGSFLLAKVHHDTALTYFNSAYEGIAIPTDEKDDFYLNFAIWIHKYVQIGKMEEYLGNYSQALERFERGLESAHEMHQTQLGGFVEFKLGMGMVKSYTMLGNFKRAREALRQCINLARKKDHPRYEYSDHFNLGKIFTVQDQLDSAWFHQMKALELDTSSQSALFEIGCLAYMKGQYKQAEDTLTKVLENPLTEKNLQILVSLYLGAIDVEQGEVENGLKRMTSSLDSMIIYADKVEAHRVLGEVLIELERDEDAELHLEKGRAMAEKSGMKGELKKYDELLARLDR